MDAAEDLARVVGTAPACVALTVNRASLYRRRRGHPEASPRRPTPSRALAVAERDAVCDLLHSGRFADRAPAQVYGTLHDEDRGTDDAGLLVRPAVVGAAADRGVHHAHDGRPIGLPQEPCDFRHQAIMPRAPA